MLALALVFGIAQGWWTRLGLLCLVLWLADRGHRLLWRNNRHARRISWGSDGRWQLQDARLVLRYVELRSLPHQLGPLIWLPLAVGKRRFPVLIDSKYAEPVALSALKAALKLAGRSRVR